MSLVTVVVKINEGKAIADCSTASVASMGDKCGSIPTADIIEQYFGRTNTPILNDYFRATIDSEFLPALSYLKVAEEAKVEVKQVEEELPIEGEIIKKGVILDSKLEPITIDSKLSSYTKADLLEKMEAEPLKCELVEASFSCAVEYQEVQQETLPFTIVAIEEEYQEMFNTGNDAKGNPQYLGLISNGPPLRPIVEEEKI